MFVLVLHQKLSRFPGEMSRHGQLATFVDIVHPGYASALPGPLGVHLDAVAGFYVRFHSNPYNPMMPLFTYGDTKRGRN
jgi:hypothetical protein